MIFHILGMRFCPYVPAERFGNGAREFLGISVGEIEQLADASAWFEYHLNRISRN